MISDAFRRPGGLAFGCSVLADRFAARPIAVAASSQTLYQRLMWAAP
jgi:hypothetical protein